MKNNNKETQPISAVSPMQGDLLNYAISTGIIDFDSVHDEYMASKKEQVIKNHSFAITEPTDTNPRWQTYFKESDGSRKLVRAKTKDELYDKLVPLYFSDASINKMTFEDLFKEWLAYKTELSNSSNTPMRHRQRYEKYFKPSPLNNMKVRSISELTLERECNRIVKDYDLSSKEWVNTKTIANGMFKYAVRQGYLTSNPMEKIEIIPPRRDSPFDWSML